MIAPESVLDFFRARRSIRRYTAQPVPRETVERLLEAARWAPSAHNRQPWRFVVVETRRNASLLAEAMAARLRADRLADGDPPEAVEQDAARSQARILNAPVLILLCLTMAEMDVYPDRRRRKAEFMMAVQSVALAAQNLLLAAHAEGLGACWLCAPLFCPDVVRAALDLPPDWEPQGLITLGYAADSGKPATRRNLKDSVIWK
jgi:F420 biosynthesis protein FbiB-like protein